MIRVVDYSRYLSRSAITSPSFRLKRLTTGDREMTDDEVMQEELRAVRAYFAHREGADEGLPLSDVVAALMRHCLAGTK
jgi:hypothetical protein